MEEKQGQKEKQGKHTYFEYVLPERDLVLLPVLLVDRPAEGGEVDVAVPGDLVGEVQDLLLQRVQTQHLEGWVEILEQKENLSDFC